MSATHVTGGLQGVRAEPLVAWMASRWRLRIGVPETEAPAACGQTSPMPKPWVGTTSVDRTTVVLGHV
jgi:hypothetical protein